eukprot:14879067-Alexandrium_andersonii.AAC.1
MLDDGEHGRSQIPPQSYACGPQICNLTCPPGPLAKPEEAAAPARPTGQTAPSAAWNRRDSEPQASVLGAGGAAPRAEPAAPGSTLWGRSLFGDSEPQRGPLV